MGKSMSTCKKEAIMPWQRRYERVSFFCPVEVTVLPDGPTVPGHAFDISLGGVGITLNTLLERGQDVRISFQLRHESEKCVEESVWGRVVNFESDVDCNRVGIEFLGEIPQSSQLQLATMIGSL
jgi:c-di-GMP-binding flagellar brake protein YcgR